MGRKPKIRVLVVEDSDVMAREITRAMNAHPRISVVGRAANGKEGLELLRELNPDVVTVDVNMPTMDGLTFVQFVMVEQPTPCVVVSALTGDSAIETFEAYELGAVSVVEKPSRVRGSGSLRLFKRRLCANVVRAAYAEVGNVRRATLSPQRSSRRRPPRRARDSMPGSIPRRLVLIGASTGGPRTLLDVVPPLPQDLGAAVIVVQHMPGNFTGSYAQRLDEVSNLPVVEAMEGERLADNTVYVAPGDFHLFLRGAGVGHKSVVELRPNVDEDEAMIVPSIDHALHSAIEIYGTNIVGVELTGLGSDGADAMARLHELGGTTIAESETSAVIFGMPKSVIERGAATHVLPSRRIADAIVDALAKIGANRD